MSKKTDLFRESYKMGLGSNLNCDQDESLKHVEFRIVEQVPVIDAERAKKALESQNEKIIYRGDSLLVLFKNLNENADDVELCINFKESKATLSVVDVLDFDCSCSEKPCICLEGAVKKGLTVQKAFSKIKEELAQA
jgi:hypothetical protein